MFAKIVCGLVAIAAAAPAAEWTKTFPVSGMPELRVETNDAAVRVRTWEGGRIQARVTTRGWEIGRGEVEVTDRQAGNRVEIEVHVPNRSFGLNFGMSRSVVLELEVPREIATDIHTGDGSITVDGVAGASRLTTGDGSIQAMALDGSLEARTGDGRVVASGRFDRVDIETSDGSVEAEIRRGSKMSGSWRVRTGDGSVRLRVPTDLAADLDVITGDGSITVDLPLTMSGLKNRSNVRGRLNGGGPLLTIRTGDGSIHVGRL